MNPTPFDPISTPVPSHLGGFQLVENGTAELGDLVVQDNGTSKDMEWAGVELVGHDAEYLRLISLRLYRKMPTPSAAAMAGMQPVEPLAPGSFTLPDEATMQVSHEADRTGVFIETTQTALRSLTTLPMYEPVAVLSLAEVEKLTQAATDRDAAMAAQSETREKLNAALLECARMRDVLRTYNITVSERQWKPGPQPCSHCGGNGWEP